MKNQKKFGPKPLAPYPTEVESFMKDIYSRLSEKERRLYAAVEALKLPRGGKAYIMGLLGCSKKTLYKGIKELENPETITTDRIRREGAGRKSIIETTDNINEIFLKVIDDHIAGDPMDNKIRWTNLSHKKIASKMKEEGITISVTVVKKLLKKHNFVKRKPAKTVAIGSCENRNEQFENITRLKEQYLTDGNPVISVDTKKKNS